MGTKAWMAALVVVRCAVAQEASAVAKTDSVAPVAAAKVDSARSEAPDIAVAAGTDTSGLFRSGTVVVFGQARNGLDKVHPGREIDADPRSDVAHALSYMPGVEMTFGGNRNETQLAVRGFDSRQVAVFLDGIPIYVPYDGNLDLARFSTNELSAISVEKGYSALSYGPNAMGGAINLVSRAPRQGLDLMGEMGLRSIDGQEGKARVGYRAGPWYAQANASFLRRPDWSLPEDFKATKYEDGGVRLNSQSWDRTLNGKLGWSASSDREFAIMATDQHGEKQVPVYAGDSASTSMYKFWRWPYWDKRSVYGIGRWRFNDVVSLKVPVYYDRFANSLYAYDDTSYTKQKNKSSFRSDYDDHSAGGSAIVDLSLGLDTARVFAHLKSDVHDEGNTTNDTAKAATKNVFLDKPRLLDEDLTTSLGLEGTKDLGMGLSLSAGASWTRREAERADSLIDPGTYKYQVGTFSKLVSDDAFDAQGRIKWASSRESDLSFSLSSRTRMPTIKERYSFKLGTAIPNPGLEPERSLQADLSWTGRPLPGLSVQASLWEAWVTDVIMDVKVSSTTTQSQNKGTARFGGWEWSKGSSFALPATEIALREVLPWKGTFLSSLALSSSYAYIVRRNLDSTSLLFVNVPEHQWTGSVQYGPTSWLELTWTTQAASARQSFGNGRYPVAAYSVSHLKGDVRLGEVTLEAGLQNVFDQDYQICEGFPEEGRSGFATVTWEFGR